MNVEGKPLEFGLFVTFDDSMTENYSGFIQQHKLPVFSYSLPNYSGGPVSTLVCRIQSRQRVREKTLELIEHIERNGWKSVYFATSEGYISANAIPILRKRLPEVTCISLQHGLFYLRSRPIRAFIVWFINTCSSFLLGIKIIGHGFGGIKTDCYYVYSKPYREYLIKHRGWSEDRVIVDMGFLKPEYTGVSESGMIEAEAVFFLQPLAHIGLCRPETELRIFQNVVNYLAGEYSELLIKDHPRSTHSKSGIKLPANARFFEESRIPKCQFAYSFFSTALLEAELIGTRSTAIFLKIVGIHSAWYKTFSHVISYEEVILPALKRNSIQAL